MYTVFQEFFEFLEDFERVINSEKVMRIGLKISKVLDETTQGD